MVGFSCVNGGSVVCLLVKLVLEFFVGWVGLDSEV